jgi:hypothetical protein
VLDYFASDGKYLEASCGTAGGGGDDIPSARFAIDTLMQLSFFFEDDKDVSTHLLPPGSGAEGILDKLLKKGDKLGPDVIRNVNRLLARMHRVRHQAEEMNKNVVSLSNDDTSTTVASHSSHIVISYAWDTAAKPALVRFFAHELRKMGYDVWLHEVYNLIVDTLLRFQKTFSSSALQISSEFFISPPRMVHL